MDVNKCHNGGFIAAIIFLVLVVIALVITLVIREVQFKKYRDAQYVCITNADCTSDSECINSRCRSKSNPNPNPECSADKDCESRG